MNLTEQNNADARLRREHTALVTALREAYRECKTHNSTINHITPVSLLDKWDRLLEHIEPFTRSPLPDGGALFDGAVDRIIAYTDRLTKELEGK